MFFLTLALTGAGCTPEPKKQAPAFYATGTAQVNISGDIPFSGTVPVSCSPGSLEGAGVRYQFGSPTLDLVGGSRYSPWSFDIIQMKTRTPGYQNLNDLYLRVNIVWEDLNQDGTIKDEAIFKFDPSHSSLFFNDDLHQATFKGDLVSIQNPKRKDHIDIKIVCDHELPLDKPGLVN